MIISCTAFLFVFLASTNATSGKGFPIGLERGICHYPVISSPYVVISAALETMTMTTTTTRRMVSKDKMNAENDDKESKKGKRMFGYAGARYLEQENLEEEEAARNVNIDGGRQGGVVGDTDKEVMV